MAPHTPRPTVRYDRLVRLATAYDADTGDNDGEQTEAVTFVLPDDYATLPDARLAELEAEAVEVFNRVYDPEADPASLSNDDVAAMGQLADAVEALRAEQASRAEQGSERAEQAAQLAARVTPASTDEGDGDGTDAAAGESTDASGGDQSQDGQGGVESVTAGSRQRAEGIRVNIPAVRAGQRRREPAADNPHAPSIVAAPDLGLTAGAPVTIDGVAEQLLRRTQGMTDSTYRAAFDSGRRVQTSIGLLSITKGFPNELVASADNGHEVLARAVDQSRLPEQSLVAAGGWCAPSQTVYDLAAELEAADGLVSVPEFQVIRGGIRFTRGPDFATLYAEASFNYTEAEDEAGDYDGYGAGEKPCFRVDCPDFTDLRLSVAGLCITAGILQNRAYPEVTARTIRGALVAHQHRMASRIIDGMVADSTAVTWPAAQVGATAPLLTAIEAQASHYRNVHRMADSAVLEAVFPRWVRGLIRSDLSRRQGVDLLAVTDAQITGWFTQRGINPQFVYNYQDLTGAAGSFTAFPETVSFLLYAAGTWARGSSDVITMDAIFDSALLRQNDFTALFTEEGWLLARRGHDSRVVTVPVCADGATHGGVLIDCDGSASA